MHKRLLLIFILSLSLAACNQSSSAHGIYNCERGVVLDVTFTDGKRVDIKSRDAAHALARVASASGAKYEGEGTIFISKGIEAMFIAGVGIKVVHCRRR